MIKYSLIAVLLSLLCFSCREKNQTHDPTTDVHYRSLAYCDSVIREIELDSVANHQLEKYQELLLNNTFDTLSTAVLLLQLFNCDTSTQVSKYDVLNRIVSNETYLKQFTRGKTILAQAFAKRIRLHKSEGNFDQVIFDCEHYLLYGDAATDSIYRSPVLKQLGSAYLRLGDSKKAIASLNLSLQYANEIHNAAMYANSSADLANAFAQNEKLDDAVNCLENGLRFPKISNKDRDWLMMMRINYLNNDQDKMKSFLDLLKITQSNDIRFICYKSLTDIYFQNKLYKESLSYALKSIDIPNQESREIAKQYLAIGNCYSNSSMLDSAKTNYDRGLRKLADVEIKDGQVLPLYEKMKPENTIYDLLLAKADLIINQTQTDSVSLKPAIMYLESAIKVSDLLRRQLVFDESKFDMGVDLKLVSEKLIQVYFSLSQKYPNSDYAKKAFMVVENSKAVTLQDNTEKDILQEELTDSNYTKFIEIRKQLSDVEIALHLAERESQRDSLTNLSNQLTSQLGIYKSLSDAILPANESNISFNQLHSFLRQHNYSTLSYFMSDDKLFMFFVNPESQKIIVEQGDKDIIDSISMLCNLQQDQSVYSTQKNRYLHLSNLVYESIFKKVVGNFNEDKQRILILADGILHNLAFDALLTDHSKMNSFLIKQYNFSNAFSIRSLITQEKRERNSTHSVLINTPFATCSVRQLASLPNSKLEAKQISSLFSSVVFSDSNATFDHFKNNLSNNNFLHIASHATAGESPQLNFYDTAVYVNSIYQLPMNQSLAYLNTCQSGAGTTMLNEGNLSLGRAFFSNGVHNIILTLWNMNDASSSQLSELFYKNLKQSENSVDALHEAKLTYLNQQPPDKQAPYYWAGVQHIGDGTMDSDTHWNLTWIALGLIAFFLVLIIGKKKLNNL